MKEDLSNLTNYDKYYMYADLVKNGSILIDTKDITHDTYLSHSNGIYNILKDGIETDYVHHLFISLKFDDCVLDLNIFDYYINLLLWRLFISAHQPIEPKHILLKKETTADTVKEYIDTYFIEPNVIKMSNKFMNNVIADTLFSFHSLNIFSQYLADTLCMEDTIDLAMKCPEFDALLHDQLVNKVPLEKIKDVGLENTNKGIEFIKNADKYLGYDHCLKYAFMAKEGINIRQFKEEAFNIGTKPDGQGGVFHEPIDSSYEMGALGIDPVTGNPCNLMAQFIDSSSSRFAQIISKKNVGDSGKFARILGLNNADTFLHPDPNYDCHTRAFLEITIKDKKTLKRFNNRYYRFDPDGIEYKLSEKDEWIIGRKLYMRSPTTCWSHAHGRGICYKCYGDLAYINSNINVGKIAAEMIGSQYTQMRLSAKHLLESLIRVIKWYKDFYSYFELDSDEIRLKNIDRKELMNSYMLIDLNEIQNENDDDEVIHNHQYFSNDRHSMEDEGPFYSYYITGFKVQQANGEVVPIGSYPTKEFDEAKLYLSNDLMDLMNKIIDKEGLMDDDNDSTIVSVPLSDLIDSTPFYIKIENNDLGKNLDLFMALINKSPVTKTYTRNTIIEALLENTAKGKIKIDAVHLEVLMANQIRSGHDILMMPDWSRGQDEPYELLTLDKALTNNPSVLVTLMYQKIARETANPLNFRKQAPSIYDPLFMRMPKRFLECDHEVWDIPSYQLPQDKKEKKQVMRFYKSVDPNVSPVGMGDKLLKPFNLKQPEKHDLVD